MYRRVSASSTPVTVLFGNGGAFEISLGDMSFSDRGAKDQLVAITLSRLGEQGDSNDVPEPASIALFAIGLACIASVRRKRAN